MSILLITVIKKNQFHLNLWVYLLYSFKLKSLHFYFWEFNEMDIHSAFIAFYVVSTTFVHRFYQRRIWYHLMNHVKDLVIDLMVSFGLF